MAEVDAEVIERAVRWCAEAGRAAHPGEVRAALAPLTWDELLLAKAILAGPPPARPLGPRALADIARGTPPTVAAEREQAGQYQAEAPSAEDVAAEAEALSKRRRRSPARKADRPPAAAPVVVRRARDLVPEPPPGAPPLPLLDELLLDEGRAVVERLVRVHGARRDRIAAALAAAWRRTDGSPVGEEDLARLLDRHGMTRGFERRERDLMLHALRAAGGVRARAAAELGTTAERLDAAFSRLGAEREAEAVREDWRRKLLARATLAERVQLLSDEERLADLGILDDVL
jgi:hypothetical protein